MTEDQIGVLATCCIIFLLALAVHAFFVVGKFAFVQLRKETLEEVVRDGEEQLKKSCPVMIIRVFFSVWLRWVYRFRLLRQELFYCISLRGRI